MTQPGPGATLSGAALDQHDDYATATEPTSRKWSSKSVLMVLLGILSAFFFPATGGAFWQAYGGPATWIALAIAFVVLTALIIPISRVAVRQGLSAEMITRGCGFGFRGSAIPGLVYFFTFVIYAALEGQILSSALESVWHIPIGIFYVFVGLLFIPLTWWGMSQLAWTMWLTFPIYLVLMIVAIVIANRDYSSSVHQVFTHHAASSGTLFAAVVGVLAAISGTIGLNPMEFADYTRFVPPNRFRQATVLAIGLPVAIMMFVAFPLGMYFTSGTGSTNPGAYLVTLLGPTAGVILAWISQTRVNMTNVYCGSVAISSISTRLLRVNPGRLVAIGIVCVASTALMFGNVLGHLLNFLAWDGIFLLSWVACVVADILIVKATLRLGPERVLYAESDVPGFNVVGIAGLLAGVVVGSILYFQTAAPTIKDLAPYIAFAVAAVVHVAVAVVTRGRTYTRQMTVVTPPVREGVAR
jgi:purine-cytosine permease-like protein